jgi:hypothetical protein
LVIVSIHQPGYFPWLGFFEKIIRSDIFVFLDDAQYMKKQWHNRNKIRTEFGSKWLTVPVHASFGENINTVKIDSSKNWISEHENAIRFSYDTSNYFNQYFPKIMSIFLKHHSKLIELNIDLIILMCEILEIKTKIIKSSNLDIHSSGSKRILDICKKLDADEYLSGIMGKDYLNLDDFIHNKIKVVFQDYVHPTYRQNFQPFLTNMSIIDLILNEGPNSKKIITNDYS